MSRVGKQPIKLNSATVEIADKAGIYGGQQVKVKGPKGELVVDIRPEVKIEVNAETKELNVIALESNAKGRKSKASAYQGLYRSLVNNAVVGVNQGYQKELEIVGIGYKAENMANGIKLTIGLTHPVEFPFPLGISATIKEGVDITISGADKQMVGEVSAQIRALKKPEPYKGKGIKYKNEVIRRKAGKAAA
jgi:large subunit ribosomal protein L6